MLQIIEEDWTLPQSYIARSAQQLHTCAVRCQITRVMLLGENSPDEIPLIVFMSRAWKGINRVNGGDIHFPLVLKIKICGPPEELIL